MSASTLSSFLIFVGTAIFEMAHPFGTENTILANLGKDHDRLIDIFVRTPIYANALWFYYAGAYVESKQEVSYRLRREDVSRWEWVIRVFNQTWMLLVFIALHLSALTFASYWLVLYLTYILWDWIIGRHIELVKFFLWVDLVGFFLSLLFLLFVLAFISGADTPPRVWMGIGIFGVIYLVVGGAGIKHGVFSKRYNPFAFENFKRTNLR
jgi:hypothetical protein